MDSGSTPGNPYIREGEGLDIFQKAPYNMPVIRRSAKFRIRAELNKEGTQAEYVKLLDLKLKNDPITSSVLKAKLKKREKVVKSTGTFSSEGATAMEILNRLFNHWVGDLNF